MHPGHTYRRIEHERRFLLDCFPSDQTIVRVCRIIDFYIDGTTLRLREQTDQSGPSLFKLTQKTPAPGDGGRQGYITSIYLTEGEFRVLRQLPAKKLSKIRSSVPPFGIDVFQDQLEGLVMAEAEFDSAADAGDLTIPPFVFREVTTDERFTGGRLVCASREELRAWLQEYGIALVP